MVMPIYQFAIQAANARRLMPENRRVLTTLTRSQGANQAVKDGSVTAAGHPDLLRQMPEWFRPTSQASTVRGRQPIPDLSTHEPE